jgi:hypothetical protein
MDRFSSAQMRKSLALATLFLATSTQALHKPTTTDELAELASIKRLIIEAREQSARRAKEASELQNERSQIDPDQTRITGYLATLASMDKTHRATVDDIIHRTVALYDIHPQDRDGVVMPGLAQRRPQWDPYYSPMHESRDVMTDSGGTRKIYAPADYAAITWADGAVEVTDGALQYSVGYLADILFHESIHFEQYTTRGRGDRINNYESELEAHSESSNPTVQETLGLTAAERNAVNRVFMGEIERFRRRSRSDTMSAQFSPQNDGQDLAALATERAKAARIDAARQKAELAAIPPGPSPESQSMIDSLHEALLSQVAPAASEDDEAARRAREGAEQQKVVACVGELREVAHEICSNPPAIDDQIRRFYSCWYYLGTVGNRYRTPPTSALSGLSGCDAAVMSGIPDRCNPFGGDPNLIQCMIAAALEISRSAPGGSNVPPGRQQAGPGPTDRHSPDSWSSLNQLRGH